MMLHEKLVPGQFLLDMKNDYTNNLLQGGQPGSKLDMYNTYNYHQYRQERFSSEAQVLDLSRRCDSVETRITSSPYNSTSSCGTASPSTHCASPPNSMAPPSTEIVENKLLFPLSPPPLPQGIASLYPLYYPHIKQEIKSPHSVSSVTTNTCLLFPQHSPSREIIQKTISPTPALQSSPKPDIKSLPSLSPDANILFPKILNAATTGAVSVNKSTRPFNAYPRDPLLVAAHFTAADVLLEKTTMERYSSYRKRALDDLRDTNGDHRIVTNPKMRRTNHRINMQTSECDEKAVESSDNDSNNGNNSITESNSSINDNNNIDNTNCGGVKDEAYFERRRKNNAAAKKSRDRRRIKEDEIAIRAAYLERQNIELLCQIDALKKQIEAFKKA